jgi:hypothetical protein
VRWEVPPAGPVRELPGRLETTDVLEAYQDEGSEVNVHKMRCHTDARSEGGW